MQYRGRIEFTIDKVDKVKQDIDFSNTRNLTDFMSNMASYFRYHNKNLNAEQYDFIKTFISIVDNACCFYDDSFDRFQNDDGTPITTKYEYEKVMRELNKYNCFGCQNIWCKNCQQFSDYCGELGKRIYYTDEEIEQICSDCSRYFECFGDSGKFDLGYAKECYNILFSGCED